MLLCTAVQAGHTNSAQVLVLNSYHPTYGWTRRVVDGILDGLQGAVPVDDIHIEYLDTKRHDDPECLEHYRLTLEHKLRRDAYAVLICCDDNAFDFVLKHRAGTFAGVPVVFCGVNNFDPAVLEGLDGVTGVSEGVDFAKNLELVLGLHPDTKRIVAVGGSTPSVFATRRRLEAAAKPFLDRIRFEFVMDLPMPELLARLAALGPGDIVFHFGIQRDAQGAVFAIPRSNRMTADVCPVPAYTFWDHQVTPGLFGGYVVSGAEQGRAAARLAVRVLGGEPAGQIPVMLESPNCYMFNHSQLRRFGIDTAALPAGSRILGRPESFLHTHLRWVIVAVAIFLAQAALLGTLGVNVVRRRRALRGLSESEARYKALIEEQVEAVCRWRPDTTLTFVNEAYCRFFGKSRDELIGMKWIALLPEEARVETIAFCEELARSPRTTRYKHQVVGAGGETRWQEWTDTPVRDAAGALVEFQSVGRDITEQLALADRLRQSQKLESLGTLAGGVAHEIGNPINGILNYAQVLLDRSDADPSDAQFATKIQKEARRVAGIVADLLSFARPDKQEHRPARLSEIVESTLSLTRSSLLHDGIELIVDLPEDLPPVRCSDQQIRQVVTNLIANARDALNEKFSAPDEDKVIRITSQVMAQNGTRWIRTTVEDHGTGIPEEDREHLFDPFYTTKRPDRGTGLGLAVSHRIAAEHDGRLSFETEVGAYTRMRLDLPIAENTPDTNRADA